MDIKSIDDMYEKEEQLKSAIVFAREYIKGTKISHDQLVYLCEEAIRGGTMGHRAEIAAARVALASAALEDATNVRADDLRLAVKLAIFPRSKFAQNMPPEEMMPPPPPPPSQAPQPESKMDEQNKDNEEEKEDEDKDEEEDKEEEEDQEEQGEPSIPEEFMFDAEGVPMEDDMMKVREFNDSARPVRVTGPISLTIFPSAPTHPIPFKFGGRQKSGKGGKSGIITSRDRGRYLRPVMPKEGEPIRVAIDATLREAAKNQVCNPITSFIRRTRPGH